MKRSQDKIKDYVEPQAFDDVQDYARDPARALNAYRFTDATSDLMARWLETLADLPRNQGAARALAGLRGVGKSHTLAAIAALAAFPDLRQSVSDGHVSTSARRLLSRPYKVVRVDRGTRATLQEEMTDAFARSFGGNEADWAQEPAVALAVAAHRSNGPFLLLIDTAPGHEVRVRRDDGPLLSELAAATKEINAFVALALDDDIEGADGANVSLSGAFQIDYLDPEHLYRIADLHLFPKNAQARTALREIYKTLRYSVPGFNWSEPRFAAIYPIHPLIADVAAAVRLYATKFAFLTFASTAGTRAANRPALSLIVLDEVFDGTEADLRKAEDLRAAFKAYDELVKASVPRLPIGQRLQAKLILKGLFILSLDGRGATARELGAAMLFYDEARPAAEIERIEGMLSLFAGAGTAHGALRRTEDKGETRYQFNIKTSTEFVTALAASAERLNIGPAAISELLCGVARARYPDWPLAFADAGQMPAAVEFTLMWRGTPRDGHLKWQASHDDNDRFAHTKNQEESARQKNDEEFARVNSQTTFDAAAHDWEVLTLAPATASALEAGDDVSFVASSGPADAFSGPARDASPVRAVWHPARLLTEETESLRRLIALRADASLMENFGDAARAAEHTYLAHAERIWSRIYIDDGRFLTPSGEHAPGEVARNAASLARTLEGVVAPLLETLYPQHPAFASTLGEVEVAQLVGGLFSGANQAEASVQELTRLFVVPLGLASLRGGVYAPELDEQALRQPWVREVLAMTDAAGNEMVPLTDLSATLRREPYGLQREAQHLILAALVAQRRIELVTEGGDRISRRTLDRALRWDEIAGFARIKTVLHSAEELTNWARNLTGLEDLASIAAPEAREAVRAALNGWLREWRELRLLEKFDKLPDEGLTNHAWDLAASVRKSFCVAADAVEATLAETLSLEEGLQRVADAFGDSLDQFKRNVSQLAKLKCFTAELARREHVRAYLMTTEPTNVDQIESARRELQTLADDIHSLFFEASVNRFNLLWREFQAQYIEHYALMHERTMGSTIGRRAIDALTRSDEWRDFETLSKLSIVNRQYWDDATRLLAQARSIHCALPVRQILQQRSLCDCSFRLARVAAFASLPQALEDAAHAGRMAHRRTLALWCKPLAHALEALAQDEAQDELKTTLRDRARALASLLAQGTLPALFSASEVQLIEAALQQTSLPPLRVSLPVSGHALLTRDEMASRFKQWLDDLPDYPAFVEIVSESVGDAG
ncbi:MAG TPA: DUF6079 family protein [Pyrinomonadaceae bacterium]|jgi:hypothetical protein|nr:DUF6079 family protein [Pyrinomonadaceae bacterium]